MITKKLLGLIIILFYIITVVVVAQESSGVEAEVPEANQENVSISEETLVILDAEDQENLENTTALNTFSVFDFLRMLLVLGAVLGFVYFFFYLLKKAGKPKIITDSTINIISTQNLESGRSLHLIEIGPQVFLIGSGESSVQLISEITNKETLDTIKLDNSGRNDSNNTFTDIFKGLFKKDKSSLTTVKTSFMKKQQERLRNM
ncbi:MAG: flagellar biosynthetic protein FliO [Spirochaetia bacterium]|nr:flagellar biosynthetic protein FliO [Spirochaetia bacterium]